MGLLTSCGVQITSLTDLKGIAANSIPRVASLRVMSLTGYWNSQVVPILSTTAGKQTDYCLLANDTNVNHCAWVAGKFPGTFDTGVANGSVVVTGWSRDSAVGINSAAMSSSPVMIDTVAPTISSITYGVSSPVNQTSNWPVTYTGISEPYASYCWLENDTDPSDCTWTDGVLPAPLSASAGAGSKVLSFWIRDLAGNTSARIDAPSMMVNYTAPTLASLTLNVTSPTNAATAPLVYGAQTGTVASTCILLNDTLMTDCTWVPGSEPSSVALPSDGTKTASIWLRDAAGNTSTRVDSNSIVVDTDAPSLASAAISNSSPTSALTYGLTYGTVTGTYARYCILENSTTVGSCTWNTGSLPSSFTVSATENAKTLSVWLKDAAGNVSTRVDTGAVTLDQTSPVLASVTISNADPTNDPNFSLSYGAVSGTYASYCIRENSTVVSGCTWTVGTLPSSFTVVNSSGVKKLSVWLRDAAGNVSIRTDSGSITLDVSTLALASATIGNSTPTNTPTYSLTYGSAGTYNRYCILENDTDVSHCTFTTASLPASYTVSATENAKVLSVWIQNAAGTVSSRVDTTSVTLDTTPPVLASAAISNASPTNTTAYALTFGAVTGGTYASYCILENSTTIGSCSWTVGILPSSFTVSSTENAKVLSVWLKDAAGNVSARKDTGSVTLRTTAPVLASAAISNPSPTNSATYALTYGTVTGTYASYCILENSTTMASCTFTVGTLPASFTVSATENAKVLSVWLKDSAGNTSTRVDTGTVTLDTTAPTLASASVSNSSPTNTTTYSINLGAQTGSYSKYCILENSATVSGCTWTTGSVPASFTVSPTNNAKVLSLWLKDDAGNVSTRVDTTAVTLDTSVPVLASASITNTSPTNNVTYGLTFGSVTGTYDFYCVLENSTTVASCSWTAGTLPASYVVTNTENAKTLSFWLKDTAGNVSTRIDTGAVTLDTTPPATPTVALADPNTASVSNTNHATNTLTITGDTGASKWCVIETLSTAAAPSMPLPSDACFVGTKPTAIILAGRGTRKIYVYTEDSATNVSSGAGVATFEFPLPSALSMTGPSSIPQWGCSDAITVTALDSYGLSSPSTTANAVTLSGAGSGAFYSDAGCTVSITQTISVGDSAKKIYYKSGAVGAVTLTGTGFSASATLAANVDGVYGISTARDLDRQSTCAIVNGGIQCWGENGRVQLGNDDYDYVRTLFAPNAVSGASSRATEISVGSGFSCAVIDGAAKCWGDNWTGQIGTPTQHGTPQIVTGLSSGVRSISAGTTSACAILGESLTCWGSNDSGQLGNGTTGGSSFSPVQVVGLTSGVTAVAAGSTSCAIVNGGLKCWGANGNGQFGDNTTSNSNVPVDVPGMGSGVTSLSISGATVCAVKSGVPYCWGMNNWGNTGDTSTLFTNILTPTPVPGISSGATLISVGYGHGCANVGGGLKCWGHNSAGQLGVGAVNVNAVTSATAVPGLSTGVITVNSGLETTCAVLVGGQLRCWGSGGAGQRGDAIAGFTTVPVRVNSLGANVAFISATSYNHRCAVTLDGKIYCWGDGLNGQLGDGQWLNNYNPTFFPTVSASSTNISTGESQSCGVVAGAAKCWGWRYTGVPTQVPGLTSLVTKVSTNALYWYVFNCAVVDGGVRCWGDNYNGVFGNNTINVV